MASLQYLNTQNEINVLLQNWEKYCEEQSQMHSISVDYFRTINYLIAIPAILLSTFSGAGSIGLASSCDTDSLSIALGFLVLVSGAMFSIHRYMNIPELQQMHDFYGDEFYKLSNSIRLNLVLSTDDSRSFRNIQEYAKFIKGQIDICVDKAPGIPRHVLSRTKQRLGQLTIMSKCGDTDNHSDITYNPPIPRPIREIQRIPEIEAASLHNPNPNPNIANQRAQKQLQSSSQLRLDIRDVREPSSSHVNSLFIQEEHPHNRGNEPPLRTRKDSSSMTCINPDTMPS